MNLTVEVTGTKELLASLEKAGDIAQELLGNAMRVEAELIMTASKREAPVDEGILRASGFVKEPVEEKGAIVVELGYGGAASDYAIYMHEGTGPAVGRPAFFPPVEAFRGWARRVLGDESLAFVVARSVGQKGLKPRKFLERPMRQRARGMAGRLTRRVKADLERGGGA
jgi:HK97 gp10 family phage protein